MIPTEVQSRLDAQISALAENDWDLAVYCRVIGNSSGSRIGLSLFVTTNCGLMFEVPLSEPEAAALDGMAVH